MKTKLLLFLSFYSICGFAQTGFFNKNEAENKYVNGFKEGKWILFADSSGNFNITDETKASYYRLLEYKNGKPYGIVNDFFKNGQLRFQGRIISFKLDTKEDKKDGLCKWYYDDGSLQAEYTFIDGLKCGGKSYYKSGKLHNDSAPCIDSIANGSEKSFYETGELEWETPVVNGNYNGIAKEYYKNGKLKGENSWVNGEQQYQKKYYESGQMKSEIPFINGKGNGVFKSYYENGILKNETPYTDSKKNGISKGYDEKGNLIWETTYTDDKKNGTAKSYDSKGRITNEVTYKNDVKHDNNVSTSSNNTQTSQSGYSQSTSTNDRYIGTWIRKDVAGKSVVSIKKNDENYLITSQYIPDGNMMTTGAQTYMGKIESGCIKLMNVNQSVCYLEGDDTILFGSTKMKRQ